MAKFDESYEIAKKMEGGYSFHNKDKGGETYAGISRHSHPYWDGWVFISNQKPIKRYTIFPELETKVASFYKSKYWKPIQGHYLPQVIANQLLDFAIHSGVSKACKSLQTILNNNKANLRVDGKIGKNTLYSIANTDSNKVANQLLEYRKRFLLYLAKTQPVFKKGWLNRISYLNKFLAHGSVTPLIAVGLFALFLMTKK